MTEYPIHYYAHELRRELPARLFAPSPRRLCWLLLHLAVIGTSITAIAFGLGGWPARVVLSLVLGHSFACVAFVAHETLHGAVVRGRYGRLLVGWLGFLPFAVSPTLWTTWHNRVHHAHTAQSGVDPDTYPTLARYRQSRAVRLVDHISVGGRRWAGLLTLCFGFTGQSLIVLFNGAALGMSARQRQAALLQTMAALLVWALLGYFLGAVGFLFAFVIPHLIGNAVVMAYILSNHSLSPLTRINDPLLNSLSVTAPRLMEILHLQFGFHVEHHLFPAMSPRHARRVREGIRRRWPERYQAMPLTLAFRLLWISPRVYEDALTLLHPRRFERWRTLIPREHAAVEQYT